ncbi:hypothetical protein BGX23_008849 [Mortierella sp. AD031]|nr:hypothetical protein BGX23_008849 [Mortierella sp. AD031]
MSHHSIAHPYDLRLQFWGPKLGLDQLKDQVLHLTVEPVEPASNCPTSKFNRDIYLATFDMLWRKLGDWKSTPYEHETDSETKGIFSWPYAFVHMIPRKCRLIQKATVECHDFDLKTLDNPAITALVEYKW